ncbi:MAG: xanthine dehydrogenase family protein subunit M [Granulosicoccus sp.]
MTGNETIPLRVALEALSSDVQVLAGGTDFFPALSDRSAPPDVLDLGRVEGLRDIECTAAGWRIGAAVTWSELVNADLPVAFDALKTAGKAVGSLQIQNAGTIGGNICNASPAADGVPPLLCLDAQVQLASAYKERTMPLTEFIRGPRSTVRQPDELLLAIIVPAVADNARSCFFKLGARRYLVISIAMVSVQFALDEQENFSEIRIAVGSCSAVARRLYALENVLEGRSSSSDFLSLVTPDLLSTLEPIDDLRSTASYRLHAAREIICRLLVSCVRSFPDVSAFSERSVNPNVVGQSRGRSGAP